MLALHLWTGERFIQDNALQIPIPALPLLTHYYLTALAARVIEVNTKGRFLGAFIVERTQWALNIGQALSEVSMFFLEGTRWLSCTIVWFGRATTKKVVLQGCDADGWGV